MDSGPLRERFITLLQEMRDEDPEGWPERLICLVAAVANLSSLELELLADAAVQAAATAHQLRAEGRGEFGDPQNN